MRTALTISPVAWLTSQPSPVDPAKVLPNYRQLPQVYEFKGPEKFVRAAGFSSSLGKLANPYGGWWTPEQVVTRINMRLQQFEGWLPAQQLRRALPTRYRALAAICGDWNDLSEIFELSLPANETIQGLVGEAKEQPEYSHLNPSSTSTPMFSGGADQVFFKVKNPFWVQPVHW